jgi:hypothetical protein
LGVVGGMARWLWRDAQMGKGKGSWEKDERKVGDGG